MATIVYTDYYRAYDAKKFDTANVNFLALLCDYSYTAKPTDKLADVKGLIIAVPYVIQSDDMVTLGMGEIMKKAEADIKAEIAAYPERVNEAYRYGETWDYGRHVVMFNPDLEILCWCESINEHLNSRENG
jgi:uncharacterized protein involved in high-affinity Fe2+ transport